MRDLIRRLVTEPGVETPEGFARRVRILAATYAVLFVASCAGVAVIALNGKLFVTLAQRSNVETLTVLFLLVLYGYLAVLSWRGAWGAARLVVYATRRRFARDALGERRRQLSLLGDPGDGPWAAASKVIEREDGTPLRFELRDAEGTHGFLAVDGARISHFDARSHGSADLLAYLVHQVADVTGADVSIVGWGQLDDDGALRYLAQVEFARALRRHLDAGPLWPTLSLTSAQCEEIARRIERIAPALLEEALLPDWEYKAEHKLPVIPEPLGLVSLGRSASRADPVATMGFATLMVLLTLAVAVLFVLRPPWVPG